MSEPKDNLGPVRLFLGTDLHGQCQLLLPFSPEPGKFLPLRASGGKLTGKISGSWHLAPTAEYTAVIFHLTNWPLIHGKPIRYQDGSITAGRIELATDGWNIALDPIADHKSLADAAREVGGTAITYVGRLARHDGAKFTSDAASAMLTTLHWFLSFARESWTAPVLATGITSDGQRSWHDFASPLCDPWESQNGWFAHRDAEALVELWPSFYAKWTDDWWQKVLRRVIWWYVASAKQSGGSDGSLILAQGALELLAWVEIVEKQKVISRRGFEDLSAADKLRLLTSGMRTPTEFHPRQAELAQLSKRMHWTVAPWALTEVRNRLVHPRNRDDLESEGHAVFDAYWLAMHYLELGILYICDYRGRYTHRISAGWRGETEVVPWAR